MVTDKAKRKETSIIKMARPLAMKKKHSQFRVALMKY